jgi:hypothetical protein
MSNEHLEAPSRISRDRRTLAATAATALVLFASLWVEAPEAPEPGASASRIRSYLETNLDQIGLAVTAATVGFGAMLLLTVALWRLASAQGAGRGAAAVTLLLTGAMTSLWLGFTASVDAIPLVAANDDGKLSAYSDQTLLTLDFMDRLGETFGDISTVSRGLFLVSIGLLVVRHRVLPRWTGYFALVVGVVSLVGIVGSAFGPLAAAWLVGLFGFVLWVLVVGVASLVMLVRSRSHTR